MFTTPGVGSRVFCFSILSLLATQSLGRTIDYFDGAPTLRNGFDPQHVTTNYSTRCLDDDGERAVTTYEDGVSDGIMHLEYVDSMSSLVKKLGMSVSASASYAFATGSASYSNDLDISFNEHSVVWSASVKVNLGKFSLSNLRPGKFLQESKNARDVLQVCGPEVVTSENRGLIASIIYEVNEVSNSEKQLIKAAIAAAYGGPQASGKANRSVSSAIEHISKKTNIKVHVFVHGGPGRAALAEMLDDPTNLQAIRVALRSYVSKLTIDNAKPLSIETTPISQFKLLNFNSVPNASDDRISEIFDQYVRITDVIKSIRKYLRPTTTETSYLNILITPAQRASLVQSMMAYDKIRNLLSSAGLACLNNTSQCLLPEAAYQLPPVAWPVIPPPPRPVLYWGPQQNFGCASGYGNGVNGWQVDRQFLNLVTISGDQNLLKKVVVIENGVARELEIQKVSINEDIHQYSFVKETSDYFSFNKYWKQLSYNPGWLHHKYEFYPLPNNVFAVTKLPLQYSIASTNEHEVFGRTVVIDVIDIYGRERKLDLSDTIQQCFNEF